MRRTTLTLCAVLTATAAMVAGCAKFDSEPATLVEVEPNETAAAATTNGDIATNLTLAGSAEAGGLDFFRFSLPSGTDIVEIEFRRDGETSSNIELSLTDSAETLVSTSSTLPVTLERDTFSTTVTGQTEVFLRIRFGVAPAGVTAIGYSFVWRALTFDQTHEDDDNKAQADTQGALSPNVNASAEIQPGESDFYLISATSGQRINAVLSAPLANGNLSYAVHDSGVPPLITADLADSETIYNLLLTGTGPYYIRVFVTGVTTSDAYTLYWQVVG